MCFYREGTQPQTHPNIDKGLFGSQRVIGMKQAERPFPVNTDVGVLKWRFVTEDESMVPLMSKLTITQVWSPTQLYSVDFSQPRISVKSAFSTNTQSRFASVVVDGVLGPPRLVRHT